MLNKVLIKEIFESIQGEGPYVGVNQLFIRFSKCNLNCKYCDTDFTSGLSEYTKDSLLNEVNKHPNVHSLSLTGGEPLLESSFLKEFLKLTNKKIYLETNGTLYQNLCEIIDYTDIISMDIKLPSCSNNNILWDKHKNFLDIAVNHSKEIFCKVVFDENITNNEIIKTIDLVKSNNILIVLQPKMNGEILNIKPEFIRNTFYRFNERYSNIRLIPQVHKFINIQ